MKHLSIRLLMLALLVFVTGTAFTPKSRIHPVPSVQASAKASQMFYWFMEPADFIDDYADLGYQISQMEIFTDGLVNSNPLGGILLESGYAFPTLPHTMFPQVSIYLHLF
jgi:acyl-coenzyme A synthetase/AMP-(fatty) acid ligase